MGTDLVGRYGAIEGGASWRNRFTVRFHGLSGIILSMALSAAMIGGCAGEDRSRSSSEVRLTYWAVTMTPSISDDEQVLEPLLNDFAAQSGVVVDLEVIPWQDLWTRILTAVSSGKGPDVLNIGNTWSASLQATGAFVGFDDEAMKAIGGAGRFIETTLAATGAEGQPPASIPLYGQSYGLYYNTRLFAEAGIDDPPSSWEELLDNGARLTRDTDDDGEPDQWGITLLAGNGGVGAHLAFILGRQEGGALFGEDGEPQFDSDEQVAAVRRYLDLMATHGIASPSDAEHAGTSGASARFARGEAAMMFGQASTRRALRELGFDNYAVARIPAPAELPDGGQDTGTMVAGTNLTIMNTTEHLDEALELVGFLTDVEAQVTLNRAYGTLPVIEGAYDDAAFDDEDLQTHRTILRDHAEPFPQVPEVGQMETLVGGAMKKLFARIATTGEITDTEIRSVLEKADRQMAAAG